MRNHSRALASLSMILEVPWSFLWRAKKDRASRRRSRTINSRECTKMGWDGHITVTVIPEPIAIIGLTYIFQHNVSIALINAGQWEG